MAILSNLLLCWAVLKLYNAGTCHPLKQALSTSNAMAGNAGTSRQLKTKTFMDNNFMEEMGKERLQKIIHSVSKGKIIYQKNKSRHRFLVLKLKSQKFLCMDSRGQFYTSVSGTNKDCHFCHVRRHRHYDVLHSCRGDVLIGFRHTKSNRYSHSLSHLYIVFVKYHKKDARRKRRSWHTDPSDPLGSEYPHMRAINRHISEAAHNIDVFKETITSVDDPLEVLLSYSPLTPTMEKHRINRKRRF